MEKKVYQGWLKQKEAREYLGGISHSTFKKLEELGIKRYRICNVTLYSPKQIDEVIEKNSFIF